ncbi:hypothetical protein VTK73DRAFT_1427 [Phialemonium thermophilum]|uniref:Uncharacterized protein n=1 Tax=Phialemonium thermophilum TaxID=223376 RepID=A0ABR3VTH1_9PEZI
MHVRHPVSSAHRFMRDYPGELVILSIDSDNDYDTDAGCCLYPRFTDDQWTALLDQFADGIERPCSGFGDRDLADATMNEFIGDGRGCVLMIVPGSIGTLYRNPDRGIYYYAQLANYNHETDLDSARFENRQVAEDQIARLQQQRNLSAPGQDGTRDLFHVMQWLIPNSQDVTTPLHDYAAYALGPLFWYAYSQFTPACYPNVLYVDYFGFTRMPGSYGDTQDQYYAASDGTVTALAMAVNLAIASQNCYVGGGKI